MYKKSKIFPLFVLILLISGNEAMSQTDSALVVVHKDTRIDDLVRKQIQINEETTRDARRSVPGFRIQVINSPDRNKRCFR